MIGWVGVAVLDTRSWLLTVRLPCFLSSSFDDWKFQEGREVLVTLERIATNSLKIAFTFSLGWDCPNFE